MTQETHEEDRRPPPSLSIRLAAMMRPADEPAGCRPYPSRLPSTPRRPAGTSTSSKELP